MIDLAKRICREKHEGQVDKCGKPYWMHPFAVVDGEIEENGACTRPKATVFGDLRLY